MGTPKITTPQDRPSVLIAEDEASFRGNLSFRYKAEGFRVIEAQDADEALRLIKQHSPDVVLTDIRMPGRDGIQLLDDIANHFRPTQRPVVFCMSGYSDLTPSKAFAKGADQIFSKPINLDELLASTWHFVAKNRAYRDAISLLEKNNVDMARVLQHSQGDHENHQMLALSGILHELNNILFVLLGVSEFITGSLIPQLSIDPVPQTTRKLLFDKLHLISSRIQASVEIASIVRNLVNPTVEMASQTVAGLYASLNELLKEDVEESGVELVFAPFDNGLTFKAQFKVAVIALSNLIRNACNALRDAGEKKILITAVANKDVIEISVANNGPRIPDAVAAHMFEPYFTTHKAKPSDSCGTGIGLTLSRKLVERSGGELNYDATAALTTFVLRLPRDRF